MTYGGRSYKDLKFDIINFINKTVTRILSNKSGMTFLGDEKLRKATYAHGVPKTSLIKTLL